jgi:dynein heavy chain
LDKASKKLAKAQAELQGVRDLVAGLQKQYTESVDELKDLEFKAAKCGVELERAEKLVSGLDLQAGSWKTNCDMLTGDITNLVGNMILSAGMIAYAGAFDSEYREELLTSWIEKGRDLNIPMDRNFDLERLLADPVQVRDWNICGLPADKFSIENGLFLFNSRRWPLMIDPQGQAVKWIKTLGKDKNICATKLTSPTFLRSLENGIR